MTKLNQGAAHQSSAKAERAKTKAEGTVGRRSFLKGAALFAGGTAAGTVASPFLGNSKAQAATDRLYVTGRKPQTIENNQYPRTYYPGTELVGASEMRVTMIANRMTRLDGGHHLAKSIGRRRSMADCLRWHQIR